MNWILSDEAGSTSRRYFVTAAVWMIVAVTVGLIAAIELVFVEMQQPVKLGTGVAAAGRVLADGPPPPNWALP